MDKDKSFKFIFLPVINIKCPPNIFERKFEFDMKITLNTAQVTGGAPGIVCVTRDKARVAKQVSILLYNHCFPINIHKNSSLSDNQIY